MWQVKRYDEQLNGDFMNSHHLPQIHPSVLEDIVRDNHQLMLRYQSVHDEASPVAEPGVLELALGFRLHHSCTAARMPRNTHRDRFLEGAHAADEVDGLLEGVERAGLVDHPAGVLNRPCNCMNGNKTVRLG